MTRTAVLGLPRIGPNRELKFALESHWAGEKSAEDLLATAKQLRADNWRRAVDAGIDVLPCGDASLYDQVLDAAFGVGAIPSRFGDAAEADLATYFRMARGDGDVKPLEMTKWFDTNYHYLVPELEADQQFRLRADHWLDQLVEAHELGVDARPVIVGPFTFLKLAKGVDNPLDLLDRLVPVYVELLEVLGEAGAGEIQIDEPCLVTDLTDDELDRFVKAWKQLTAVEGPSITLATYFASIDQGDVIDRVFSVGAGEVHVDLVRAPGQLEAVLEAAKSTGTRLSLGVVDGRNVWVTDPDKALALIDRTVEVLGAEHVTIAPSCSLLHIPYEAAIETGIDPEVRAWLVFGAERLTELHMLKEAVLDPGNRDSLLASAREAINSRRTSPRTNDPAVDERVSNLKESDYSRAAGFKVRNEAQRARVQLPPIPTTTIGSFPQTPEIRQARKDLREGRIGQAEYEKFLEGQIKHVVDVQEELGLDVLVHGEPERNDMVEYFGQQLEGFTFSSNGWVQSYGSRCVKPPILYGDVSRPEPMTVRWWEYAQSLTEKPMKGMLTGPVTILQWSFVRDDQPRRETCTQIALAIQDEVLDLEKAGAFAIQVDEAALREGLPLQKRDQDDYVRWAVDCFRLTVAPAANDTQIHTHMCYSEFNDMMEHIIRLDADVLSIEASRSDMEVLDVFAGELSYPNEIGPGIYDIHSPRVPSVEEQEKLLAEAEQRIGRDRLWANPDCGLKTRKWDEVIPSLKNMVEAAHRRRGNG